MRRAEIPGRLLTRVLFVTDPPAKAASGFPLSYDFLSFRSSESFLRRIHYESFLLVYSRVFANLFRNGTRITTANEYCSSGCSEENETFPSSS